MSMFVLSVYGAQWTWAIVGFSKCMSSWPVCFHDFLSILVSTVAGGGYV